VLVFLTDDHGYGDVGCYGSDRVKTPHIDRLATEGIRFTQFYAPASSCSPTRSAMLTGRNPFRLGVYTYIPQNSAMHLKRRERTIGSLLRDAGYDTCFVGKWACNGSLTDPAQPQPHEHGFDHWLAAQNNAVPSHKDPVGFVRNGRAVGEIKGYSAQIITDEAIQWLQRRGPSAKPFCLFVWFQEPHRVIATPEEFSAPYREKFRNADRALQGDVPQGQKEAPTLADYLGNIAHVDHQIGRLMKALADLGVSENTFTLFTSDNGPIAPGSTGGFRGGKGTLWEGGIHLPGIVRWPRGIKPGQISEVPVGGVDLLPTVCALAGAPVPRDRAIDGVSLLPLFDGQPLLRTTPLFWRRLGGDAAMRDGDWKIHGFTGARPSGQDMITFIAEAPLQRFELHNLKTDPAETKNLAAQEPARLAKMSAQLIALYQQTQHEGERWPERALPREEAGGAGAGKAGKSKKK
jgi:arylsulfatase A